MAQKILISELKLAIKWLEANTNQIAVHVAEDGYSLVLEAVDKHDSLVKIKLFSASDFNI